MALSKRWKEPEEAYRRRASEDAIGLGSVHFVNNVGNGITVANMVAQHGIGARNGNPPIRYHALKKCLERVRNYAIDSRWTDVRPFPSVHMPRIGCGLAGGSWEVVEQLVQEELVDHGIRVFVYDLAAPARH